MVKVKKNTNNNLCIDTDNFSIPERAYCTKVGEDIEIWFPNPEDYSYYPAFAIQRGRVLTGRGRLELRGDRWKKVREALIKFSNNKKNYSAYDRDGNKVKPGLTVNGLYRRLKIHMNNGNKDSSVKVVVMGDKVCLVDSVRIRNIGGENVLLIGVKE